MCTQNIRFREETTKNIHLDNFLFRAIQAMSISLYNMENEEEFGY